MLCPEAFLLAVVGMREGGGCEGGGGVREGGRV